MGFSVVVVCLQESFLTMHPVLLDAQAALQHYLKKKPSAVQFGALVAMTSLLVWYFFSHDTLYMVSFLAELIRTCGVLLLLQKIVIQSTVKGLSLKTQQLYVVVFFTRFLFKVFYEFDKTYALVEFLAFIVTLYIVYLMRYRFQSTYSKNQDTVQSELVLVVCAGVACILHPDVTNKYWINALWAFSTYLESTTLLPQLVMAHAQKTVDDVTAHYIASLFFSRVLEAAFWIIALVIRGYSRVWKTIPYYVIATEIVHTLLLSNFIYYYIQAWKRNSKMVLPAA